LPVVGASLLFYVAGMIWNDCADVGEDCVARPDRPLPSGRIQRRPAAGVAIGMSVAGVALATTLGWTTCVIALLLLMLVLAYDFASRRQRWLGILNMGACRGASLLLGASAATSPDRWPAVVIFAAVGIALYIVLVSRIALNETQYAGLGRYVGLLIRFLIVIQAALCLIEGRGGVVVAGLVLLGWPVSSWLGKRFYAS
jgi:4-hydroxybenzoate polyprenyltransferase